MFVHCILYFVACSALLSISSSTKIYVKRVPLICSNIAAYNGIQTQIKLKHIECTREEDYANTLK